MPWAGPVPLGGDGVPDDGGHGIARRAWRPAWELRVRWDPLTKEAESARDDADCPWLLKRGSGPRGAIVSHPTPPRGTLSA